ncbi:MAG: biopolymer transporter ExbD [Candidatus Aminicenantes bacterium]|nr:biopolymer transporter ExbD [Candidatus Aminicenantes bacterium]
MAFSSSQKERDTTAEPNVVPLCDVLLVLLIIFMVVTPLVQKGVDVRLPTAMNTISMPENPEIVLYIRKDGRMFLNSDEATEDNLQLLLEDALMTASDKKLYLKADQEMEYGRLVDVINIVKEAGVDQIGIIAEKKAEEIK